MVKLKDIASQANVSISTVSRVLNGNSHVDPEMARRVIETAAALGFRRRGERPRGQNLAFLVTWPGEDPEESRVDGMFASRMFDAVLRAAHRQGFDTLFHYGQREGEVSSRLRRQVVDGLIAGALILGTHCEMERAYIHYLNKAQIPFFRLSKSSKEYRFPQNYVAVDDYHGGYTAAQHLIQLGHEKILHIAGPENSRGALERQQGCLRALQDHGVASDNLSVFPGNFHEIDGIRCAEHYLSMDERPTAVFAANDIMAIGFIRRCREAGLHIPDQTAVVGFDGIALGDYVSPRLTTFEVPVSTVADMAVEELQKEVDAPSRRSTRILLEGRLVVRESCGAKLAARA